MAKATIPKNFIAHREATRIMMDAPTARRLAEIKAAAPTELTELSPTELLQKPTATLNNILGLLDKFLLDLHSRVDEGSATNKDMIAFTNLVKAHAALRQTQLAEDSFSRQSQTLQTDGDVAVLLIDAVKAGGPQAVHALREAMRAIDAAADEEGK